MNVSDEVYELIREHPHLPSPTGVAVAILRLAADEDCTVADMAAVIEKEPAMSARLLRLVNSPLFCHSQPIMSLPQAIVFLGLRTVKFASLGFSLVSAKMPRRCRSFPYNQFWSESLGIAMSARHIASVISIFPPDDVLACGLLSQIGRLSLACVYPREYGDVLDAVGVDATDDLLQMERDMFKLDHNELTARMMQQWNLPPLFCDAIRYQDQILPAAPFVGESSQNQLVRMLALARGIARILVNERAEMSWLEAVCREAENNGIALERFNSLFDCIRNEWTEAGVLFDVRTRPVPSFNDILSQADQLQAKLKAELDADELPQQSDSNRMQ